MAPPGCDPQAYAVFVDDDDMVWLTDFGANALVRFDPATETFTSFAAAATPGDVRQILGRPGEVWARSRPPTSSSSCAASEPGPESRTWGMAARSVLAVSDPFADLFPRRREREREAERARAPRDDFVEHARQVLLARWGTSLAKRVADLPGGPEAEFPMVFRATAASWVRWCGCRAWSRRSGSRRPYRSMCG